MNLQHIIQQICSIKAQNMQKAERKILRLCRRQSSQVYIVYLWWWFCTKWDIKISLSQFKFTYFPTTTTIQCNECVLVANKEEVQARFIEFHQFRVSQLTWTLRQHTAIATGNELAITQGSHHMRVGQFQVMWDTLYF
jgi:hypothetical protein